MVATAPDPRKSQRFQKLLSVVVKGTDAEGELWKEVTELKSISRTGAGFTLERECQVGQLLSLMLPLPSYLRCYDEDKELYKIWGLIQHSGKISPEEDSGFHIGVAFIGKHAPESYRADPQQSYKICGMSDEGLWNITESDRPFVHRRHPRYWASVEVSLTIQNDGMPEEFQMSAENTVTENISLSGALVFSNLKVDIGDCINFKSEKHDFSTLAVVRNRNWDGRTMPKLHLEFVNGQFPIQKIKVQIEEDGKN